MSQPTIAIVGASTSRHKFGNRAVRAYGSHGYLVYPVNPNVTEVEGRPAHPSVSAIPLARLDRVSIYLPPKVCLGVLDDVAKKPAGEVWLNPGADSPEVVARAHELGLPVVVGCSIRDIGADPYDLD
jgi:uncharacterized protein